SVRPRCPSRSTLVPYTTLFRSSGLRLLFRHPLEDLHELTRLTRQRHGQILGRVKLCPITCFGKLLKLFGKPGSIKEWGWGWCVRSEEHTSELQSRENLVCRLLL